MIQSIILCIKTSKCDLQGNGHERDFLTDDRVYILDIYNGLIYPRDNHAKAGINKKVELYHHTTDDVYIYTWAILDGIIHDTDLL